MEVFSCAKEITKKLEEMFKFRSFNIVVRDGWCAGNKDEHVHIDIVPREDQVKKRHLTLRKDMQYEKTSRELKPMVESLKEYMNQE